MVDFQTLAPGNLKLARIQSQLPENGCVYVGDIMPVLNRMKSKLVSATMSDAAFDSPARHPYTETEDVMIAPVSALRPRGAAEFGCEDDQRLFEQAAPIQIRKQRANRLIHLE